MSKAYDYFREISANNNDMIMPNDTDITDDSGRIHDATGISEGLGGFLANLLMPGFSTALYRPSVQNFVGGLEGDAGGAANYLGAFAKSQGEIDPDTGWNSLGDWLINNGTYWNDRADDVQQQFGTLNRYQNEGILQRLTDTDYLTDSRGLMADVFNGAGSSVPFIVTGALTPEIGIGGALARGAGGLLERMGMSTAGRAVASDLVQSGANDFARYALTGGPLEAAINAGGIYDDLKNQGLSDSEIFGKMNSMIGEELPVDMLTSGLYGAVLGGNTFSRLGQGGWKRAIAANALNTPADMLGEYMQEMTQQQLQNKYSGKPYGTFWNPTEDEMQAGRAAAMGALPMGMFGSFRGARHSHAAYQNALAPQVDPANPSAPVADTTDPVVEAQLTGKNDDVPTVDGQDVTNMSEDQFTNWFNSKVQAPQLDTSGVDVPQVQMPKTGGSGKAGAGANVLAAAQDFLGKQMANGTEGCVEAVTKIGARYNPFLASELNNGVVNVDQLVSDAGDAVIPFDPANVQAGDVIVYGDSNDPQQHVVLADGNGGYVGNSSSQNQVVQGDNYNEMGGLTPTKIIKTGNGVTASEASAENGDSAPAADLSNLPVGGIATAIAQNTGLPANLIWAQLAHESDNGNSQLAQEDHNYGGVKGEDGNYLHFDNDQQFIDYMSGYYPKYKEDGIYDAKNADEWAEALKHGGYFTAGLEEYEGGMKRHLSEAGLSDGAMSGTPANESGNSDNLGTDNGMISTKQFGDLLDAKLMDFAGTNDDTVHKIFDDMSANTKDKAMAALFAPYMTADANGNMVFANTAENRTQLAGNDAFRKVASMFIQKHLSDYAPAFENDKISIEKAMDALRPQNQQATQSVQTVQAPQVHATVSPQAVLTRIQQGLSKPQQAAVLQAANDAVRTPQGMNERDEMAFMNTLSKAIDQHDYPTIAKMIPQETAQALSMTADSTAKEDSAPETQMNTAQPVPKAQQGVPDTKVQSIKEAVQANMPVNQNTSAQQVQGTQPVSDAQENQQANVSPLPQPQEQQAQGVRVSTPQESQQAAPQAQQTAPTMNQARISELNAMPKEDRQNIGQQYVSTLMQKKATSNANLMNGLRNGDANAIEYAERNFGDMLNSTTPAESAAMASRQNTAANTNDVASILRFIPNAEIARAKTADYGGSVPIQIFQHSTRDALRKAGLTYNDENHHNHERVKTAPLYEEAMRRAEQEDNNESNSTQSQQQTSENAENQNQHAEPEQGKTAESQPASETREVSGRDKYTSRMNELRVMSEDERKALGKQHYEALKASKTHVSNDLIDDMAKGDPIAIEMVENMYGDKLKAKPEESTKQKDLVSLGNEYADKLEKAKDTIDKYTAQRIGKIVSDYTIQQLRKGEPRTIEQVKGRYFDTLFPEEASKREEARKQERARLLSDVNENGISDHDFFHGFFDNFNNNNRDDNLKIWYKEHLEQKVNYKGKEITAKEFIEESVKNGAKIESKKINPPHGWIEYSIGKHKLMPGEYAYFKYLKENNIFSGKQETKKEAKQPTQDISDTAKEALSGTSKEAQEVYRIVRDKLSKGNDATKRAADVSAIILARHADVYAKAYSKATGTKYTAMDYLHDKIGLDLEGNPVGSNVLYEAMNRGVDVNQLVDVVDITDAVPKISKEISNKELKKYIQDLVRKGTNVFSADKLSGIELKGRNTNHIVYSSFKAKSNRKYRIHAGVLHSIEDLLSHSVLIESIPNRKAKKEGKVRAYHRFYVPVRVGDKIETIRLVAEERNGEITVNPAQVDLYDVIVESKKGEPPVATARERAHINTGDSPSKITISDMLAGVKDSDGQNYIQPAWHGSRKHNQEMNGAALGSTSVLTNGKRIVSLMESADESTFLHEMGHVFMLDLQDLASIDESAARDMAAVDDWTQWKKGQANEYKGTAWEKEFAEREKQILKAEKDGDEATASDLKDEWAQERFARGLERYLESGKAPSSALKAVFERFKQFLTKIYEAFKGDGGKPSDEVQNVMARMMDSDVENTIKVPAIGEPIHGINGKETNDSIFGSVEDADKEMLDALGLSEDDLTDDVLTAPDGIKNTAEERERLEKELSAELNKMSAMPMFNPKIYTLGLKLAMTYVKDGINTVKKLVAKLNATFGDKIGPWAPALAETVRTWPKGVPFDEKKVMAISKAVGARYENGITSLDGMQADMKKLLKGQHDSFAPMIEASYNGIRKFFEAQKGENDHADDSTSGLAERAGRGSDSDAVGPDDAGRESSAGSKRERVQETESEVRPFGSVRVRDGSTASRGTSGDSGVQADKSSNRSSSAGSPHLSGSVRDSYDGGMGTDDGRQADAVKSPERGRNNEGTSRTQKQEVTKKSSKAKGRAGNIESIRKDLPMLKPEQQDDVQFIETRLSVNNKPGVMLTNGTGTGKTYSGLGYIKRLWDDGKKNVLIVAPSEEIITQWIDSAKKSFGLDVYQLESTEDKGPDDHICITTYANMQSNKELVNRTWDAVISDESHNLMNNKKGEETGYIKMLRALTVNPRGAIERLRLLHRTKEIRALEKKIAANNREMNAIEKGYEKGEKLSKADAAKMDKLKENNKAYDMEIGEIYRKIMPNSQQMAEDLMKAYPPEKRPKVLFLSATPFAYDHDIDYAEGYLFNYGKDDGGRGYNHGSPRDNFMIKNFGYRMRTGKLTRPEAGVDSRVMEVQFHDNLVKSGAMFGRQLDVDKDYDRGFILVDGGIGHKIDEGFDYLRDNYKFYKLEPALRKQFDKRTQKYLLESIKAQQVIPLVNEYVKEGKKVVLFHQSMKEKENVHPFQLRPSTANSDDRELWEQWKRFKSARPDLVELSLNDIPAPMQTLREAFGDNAVYIDGSKEAKKERNQSAARFNDDNSGVNVIICQQDAANAGVSLHDTTGKHPRVLINISMPERPSYAMQIEGRIYRVGNASNAVFRYLSTGTNIEKNMFASTIGGRAESVENLAMGDAARGLHDSFRDLYQETMDGSWKRRLPGNPEEGTGGKEMDKAATSALSEYDRAKSFYYGQQKKTSRSKSQEGRDYFATPEPIGYKMVEWLGLKAGNKALEPSAGHGAISRWFSPNTENTIVEQSDELAPIAQMNTQNAKLVNGSFENFNIVNKFDGIAMNPPYGVGGKTAMEHLRKAISHLRDHGRVIAILPEGPAADKHYNKMTEDVGGNVVEVAQIHLPQVTFNRAGTGVATKIVVLDYFASKREAKTAREDYYTASEDIDLRNIDDINELFDRMENMEVPQRPMSAAAIYQAAKSDASVDEQTQVDAATAEGTPVSSPNFESDTYEHTKTHETLYRARPNGYLGNDYKAVKSLAKRHNGYYSNFANKSFLFHTEEDRNEFVQEADAILGNGKFSAKGKVLDMLKHVEYTADEDLTDREKGIQDFGKQMGMKVVFFDGPSNLNGYHNNGVTFLNRNAAKSAPWTFWHESFHWMRNNNPQLYRQMVQYISGKQAFSPEQLSAYREAIGRPELSDAATIEEMMADAMPEVRKRVSFFRDMGKENKGLLQRFVGWIRDTMAAFHNAMSKPKAGLTSTQKNAMRDALANLAADLRDSDGKHIFRVHGKEREIVAADGKELSYEQTPDAPYNDVKFSANAKDDDREQEPAGSPSRIQRALIRLGFAGEKNSNIEIMQKSNKGKLNLKDMSVKSVRQVARKNAAVQYMYRLGRKALMEQEHLRNMYAQEMRKFNSYVKKSSNLKEAAQLLWESDAAGHAYTADELDKMGVSLEAGRAYMLARKLLADAYKRVNDARMQVMVRNKVIGRNDLQDFIRSNFLKQEDIIKTERFGNGKIRVTYRGAKVYSKNDAIVGNDEYHKLSADSNVYIKSAVRNADGTYTIDYTERIKPIANREGYMPHFFHNFMVYEKGKNDDGTERLVTIGSANSLKKAIKIAQKASDAKPEGKFVIRPQSMQFDEDYNNVVVGDRDYLKMARQIVGHTEMSWQEANDFLRNTEQVRRTNRHRFFGNAQHRTGAAGFEKDVQWALTHYLNASARYVAMEHFKPDAISFYERFFGAFKDEPKNSTAKYIKEFISDMNGTPRLLEKMANEAVSRIPIIGDNLNDTFEGRPALAVSGSISSFNAITKLGLGNFASAAINFMQFVNIGTKLNSYEYAMKGLKKALKPSAQDKAILEASGVMDEQNMSDEAGGYSQTRDYGRARKGLHAVKYVLNKSMVPFQKADTLMRQAAILGGYYQGVEKMGMKAADGEKLSRAALDYAEDVNLDANFDYSVAAAPRVMRMGSVFTQQLFQFQKYPIMQFEFFWNEVVHAKNNKQRARFLVPYCLLAGAVGAVPFGALMNLVLSSIIGTVGGDGDDYDLAEEIKADMMRWAGKDPVRRRIVNTFLYGMMSNIGINISERVGMSNAFSGEYYGNKPQSAVGAIAQAFGGPLVSTIQNLAQQCQNHNPIEAIKAVSPAIGNILQAFAGETRTTHHRVGTVYNDMWSRVMHGLGFRSTDETNDSFVNNYLYKSSQRAKEDKKDAMDAYIRNPSDENKKRMTEMGVTDKTFQSYKDSMNKSSKQRSQDQKQSKSKKETAAQKESDRLKDFTH